MAALGLLAWAITAGAADSAGKPLQLGEGAISRKGIAIGSTTAVDSKALLDVRSTTKGVLISRMNTAARDAISSPTTGLMIYNTTTNRIEVYDATAWRSLASLAGTETLTGKTLTGNTAANLVSGSGTLTLNTSGTVTLPNATDTLVGKATTDTLTNKTIDADGTGNSITNIENADIKAAAAIAVNKLAALTASRVTITDGSGFISAADTGTYPSLTELSYVKGATSSLQTQITALAGVTLPTGMRIGYVGSTAPSTWVLCSGRTIGSAASSATERANADTENLFTLLWNEYTNSELVIQDSSGAGTTRGANAAADFAANKRMPLPDYRGRAAIGDDNMGGTTASRVTVAGGNFDATVLGKTGGAQNYTLASSEIPSHGHTQNSHNHNRNSGGVNEYAPADAGVFNYNPTGGGLLRAGESTTASATATNQNTGGGGAHAILQPTITEGCIIKL